jgi:hypothetical protein
MSPLLVLNALARRAADRPGRSGTAGGRDLATTILAVVLPGALHLGAHKGNAAQLGQRRVGRRFVCGVGGGTGQLKGFGHFGSVSHGQHHLHHLHHLQVSAAPA